MYTLHTPLHRALSPFLSPGRYADSPRLPPTHRTALRGARRGVEKEGSPGGAILRWCEVLQFCEVQNRVLLRILSRASRAWS